LKFLLFKGQLAEVFSSVEKRSIEKTVMKVALVVLLIAASDSASTEVQVS